ncbi:MAG TPA: hypothetical protein VFK88_02135 [Gallionella sp.]|nr:hypothetical protein [Gallionella sp.]
MNKTILMAAVAAITLSAQPALAQQTKPAEKSTQVKHPAPNVAEFDKKVEQMNEGLKQMDALMDKIRQTQDPQERRQLLQQYWVAMQDAMGTMHGMWGPGGMGCCMGGGMMGGQGMMGGPGMGPGKMGHGMMGGPGMMGGAGMGPGMMGWGQMRGYYSSLTPEQQKQHQYMTDQYLRMQQMMMDRMMQHQYWMNQPPPAAKQ